MRQLLLLTSVLLLATAAYAQEAKSKNQVQDAKAEARKQAEAQAKLDTPQEATTDILAAPAVEAKPVNPKAEMRQAQEAARNATPNAKAASEKKANLNAKEAKKDK